MRIKSYFASTIEAALELARRELGEEAVLLNSRPAPPEARHLGIHEVVFGVEREHDPELRPAPPAVAASVSLRPVNSAPDALAVSRRQSPQPAQPPMASGAADWEAIRRQVERLERAITNHWLPPNMQPRNNNSALAQFLLERDFPAPLAGDLASHVEEQLANARPAQPINRGAWPSAQPGLAGRPRQGGFAWEPGEASAEFRERGLVAELLLETLQHRLTAHCLPEANRFADQGAGPQVLAFCGPPGGGKTTLLAKLAAVFSVEHGEGVAILSTDTQRISAAEQLRTYAAIMGLPCEVVETPEHLDRAISEQARQRWILIDAPGWSPAQFPEAEVWADYFAARPEIEKHLVLPAHTTVRQVEAAVLRFRRFGVARLALTRADEITAGGGLIAAILASGLPLSFLGTGQSVPEDVEDASVDRLLDLAFADESFLAAATTVDAPPPARARFHNATSAHAG